MSFNADHKPTLPAPIPWGIPATIAWLLFAFLVGTLVASAVYAAWQAERPSLPTASYDGMAITIGALASVPVQVALFAYAARLRRWTPATYLALNRPKPGEIVFALMCTIAMMIAFDLLMLVSGRDLVPPYQTRSLSDRQAAGGLLGCRSPSSLSRRLAKRSRFAAFSIAAWFVRAIERSAIVVIALAWAALHIQYDWVGMAQIFLAGLMLGWFRWASGSTTLTILHACPDQCRGDARDRDQGGMALVS